MKAVAVMPRQANSMHLAELPAPSLDSVPNGRGVLVQVLRVGGCGTDKEINAGDYGAAPPGYDFLVIGHENFGRVLAVGPAVRGLRPGDYVVATVRRPGHSLYDQIGLYDMTTDAVYYERGINLLHGYLTEQYVDDPEYIVKVPPALKEVGVLLEPCSVVEKGFSEAYAIQQRLKVWRPQRACVLGAGPVGLLAVMALRMRGLEVVAMARTPPPTPHSKLVEDIDAHYVSTKQTSLSAAAQQYGPFDLIFEATGHASVAFEAMDALGKDGVLILSSVTGGDETIPVPAARINLGFVLGNKVMVGTVNANREYFEAGVRDFALCEAMYPGWLAHLLTTKIQGLDRWADFLQALTTDQAAIKVYLEVAPLDSPPPAGAGGTPSGPAGSAPPGPGTTGPAPAGGS